MTAITAASPFAKGNLATATSDQAGEVVCNDFYIDVTADQLLADAMFDVGILPAGHTVVDATLISDDLDSDGTPAIALSAGLMTGTPGDLVSDRTCGTELFPSTTGAQTGTPVRMTQKTGFIILPTTADRSLGVKVVTAPDVAVAGRIRLRVLSQAAAYPQQF